VATLPRELPVGLEATESFKSPVSGLCITWPYSVHVPVVEVDIETGVVKFLRYVIVHDCGVEINPRIVEGQVVGGSAQGIGGTLFEELVYNEDGQLLTTSFMDYLIPTTTDIPKFEVCHIQTPAPQIPGGYKGMGEGGCVYSYAAVVNAVADAIEGQGVEVTSTPLSPNRVLKLLREAKPN
jgi:carbon-monoxide dehydrogenase large subunit